MYAVFTWNQTMESLLRAHQEAFDYLGGIPRKLLFDNLKSVVVGRSDGAISFNPNFLEFSSHYHFQPAACNPRSGWEKGRVERAIRYIRENFFTGQDFKTIEDANRELRRWLDGTANQRPWPEDHSRRIPEVWEAEKAHLLSLPAHPPSASVVHILRSGKLPFVRFDLNDYSIPHELTGKPLSVIADGNQIRIFDNQTEVAKHARSWGKGVRVRSEQHFTGLLERQGKAAGQEHKRELIARLPEAEAFLAQVERHGLKISAELKQLTFLVKSYGIEAVRGAIKKALENGVGRAAYLTQLLSSRPAVTHEELKLTAISRKGLGNIEIPQRDLAQYDTIAKNANHSSQKESVQ